MISYTMIGTNDVKKAEAFYAPLVKLLGGVEVAAYRSENRVWYAGATGAPPFIAIGTPNDGAKATAGNGSMNAIGAANRGMVNEVYAAAIADGTNGGWSWVVRQAASRFSASAATLSG